MPLRETAQGVRGHVNYEKYTQNLEQDWELTELDFVKVTHTVNSRVL